jgi:hypothetical protein
MLRIITICTIACLSTGCASIVSGQNQSVSVTTLNKGDALAGAKCSLANDKGTWYTTTPGSVTVRRSFNDLSVNCAFDGLDTGITMVKSATKGMAFGNILFGGFIGIGVDAATGAAYDYPDNVQVNMGQTDNLGTVPVKAEAEAGKAGPAAAVAAVGVVKKDVPAKE